MVPCLLGWSPGSGETTLPFGERWLLGLLRCSLKRDEFWVTVGPSALCLTCGLLTYLLIRWSTFISMDISDSFSISDLLLTDSRQWNPLMMTHIFYDILGARVLSIALPVHSSSDVRVWRSSYSPRAVMSDFYLLY